MARPQLRTRFRTFLRKTGDKEAGRTCDLRGCPMYRFLQSEGITGDFQVGHSTLTAIALTDIYHCVSWQHPSWLRQFIEVIDYKWAHAITTPITGNEALEILDAIPR